jgi:hypothetical protein
MCDVHSAPRSQINEWTPVPLRRPEPKVDGRTSKLPAWSREDVITAVHRWIAEYGRPPSSVDWTSRHDGYPTYTECRKEFSGWADVMAAAGIRFDNDSRWLRDEKEDEMVIPVADEPTPEPAAEPEPLEEDTPAAPDVDMTTDDWFLWEEAARLRMEYVQALVDRLAAVPAYQPFPSDLADRIERLLWGNA